MIDTKLEAFKLIHDPVRLLCLLYSKYLYIEDDFALLYTNQIMYNRKSHFNICFKEQKIYYDLNEFLHRIYKKKESRERILKLNEYYKNYQAFFCKATFTDFIMGNILKNYQETKAEIFYKKNYGNSSLNKLESERYLNYNSPSLSSLDNITYNKTIFDKKNKQIIENDDKNFSITLTSSNSFLNYDNRFRGINNLLSTNYNNNDNTLEDSFTQCVKNIVNYKKKKKEVNNDIHKKVNEKMKKKINQNKEKILLEKSNKENMNNSKNLFSVLNLGNSIKSKSNKNIKNSSQENKASSKTLDLFLSFRNSHQNHFSKITSKINQFKNNIPINIKYLNRNKSCHNNNSINRKNNNKYQNSKLKQYNHFLLVNKNNKNIKNKTYELINKRNRLKNSTSQNFIFDHYEKLIPSTIYKKDLKTNETGSKFRLFKGINFFPEFISNSNIKRQKIKDRNLNNNKKYFSLNSLDNTNNNNKNNILHKKSFSPKFISSNFNINNEKIRHIGINKLNKIGNNSCIQNNINIINKIKIQPKQNKRNGNLNINFNNLILCGRNIPTSYLENIRNNIINHQNKNLKTNKINTNFYMLSFNNYNNNIIDNRTSYKNFKKHELILNLNPNKITCISKNKIGKLKNLTRKFSNENVRNIKLGINSNKNNL